MTVRYSICMVNYNMADTLDRAVRSVACQLNEEFEIVLVDDGSSDTSVEVMHALQKEFPIINVFPLKRDKRRKLGETRNVSVREAKGEYCLLHIDCDDVYDTHLISWINVFHQIEEATGGGILLAGEHINMAKRSDLLEFGPYINIFRGEDRNMWSRFAAMNRLWLLDHIDFATRLPKTTKQQFSRSISHTIDHMITDFRGGTSLREYIYYEFKKAKSRTLKLVVFRALILPFTWIISKFQEPIFGGDGLESNEAVQVYRASHKGSFKQIMEGQNKKPDWTQISNDSHHIFDV